MAMSLVLNVDEKEMNFGPMIMSPRESEGVSQFKATDVFARLDQKYHDSLYMTNIRNGDCSQIRKFLKDAGGNVKKAAAGFEKMMDWRMANDVDNALNWTFDVEQIKQFYPHQFHKFDREGRPVYVENLGKIDVKSLSKVADMDMLGRYHVYHFEFLNRVLLPHASKLAGKRVDQIVTICDLSGLGTAHMSTLVIEFLKRVAEIDQYYYPEAGFRLNIVNVPTLFKAVWSLISPFINARGKGKIAVIKGNVGEALSELVHPDNIPEFLGGRSVYEQTPEEQFYRRLITGQIRLDNAGAANAKAEASPQQQQPQAA